MNRRGQLWPAVALTLLAVGCGGESRFGKCVFDAPDKLVKLKNGDPVPVINIARKEGDGDVLLFLTDADYQRHRSDALRVDLGTGTQSAESVPIDENDRTPAGYVDFKSSGPLFGTKTIRFAYAGRRNKIFSPWRSIDGRWSIGSDETFSGTRSIMFGDHVLVEQDIENYTPRMPIEMYVAVEPDGDRVVCMCRDTDTWLGVFSRKKLESEQGSHK